MGDSKTQGDEWIGTLRTGLETATAGRWTAYDRGVGGATVASYGATITATLATLPAAADSPVDVLCNWGANDVSALPAEATWEANYLAIIDAVRAKYANARIGLTKPWRRNYASQCNALAGWIDTIVAARPGVAYVADDERVWLENGDDGATRSTDGVHYSAAGQAEKAAQMLTAMGY